MLDLTVAIRAYNAAAQLPEILNKLKIQVGTEVIDWEIIVIDNNSRDNTAQVIQEYQFTWNERFPLKYFLETKQGSSIARRTAMEKARGSWVAFLDDDNLPASDWVAKAYSFSKSYPQLGAYGGQIHGEFEVEPPRNFWKIAAYLAIVERGQKPFRYSQVLPPGAGIVISKKAWLDSVPQTLFLVGPEGKSLHSKGEDMEFLACLQNSGWEIWYNPEMHITHKIPSWRLEREYLISLIVGSGLNRFHIRMIRLRPWQRLLAFFPYLIYDFQKALLYFIKNFALLKTDTTTACEMALFLSIFVSPFYLWKKWIEQKVKSMATNMVAKKSELIP
jgi:glycosyltransferase involved in cell wall biosynthesis